MRRAALERGLAERRWRLWAAERANTLADFGSRVILRAARSPGHFRKRHPYDCGRPRCHVCHGSKLLGEVRLRDRKADLSFAEQVASLDEA